MTLQGVCLFGDKIFAKCLLNFDKKARIFRFNKALRAFESKKFKAFVVGRRLQGLQVRFL